MKSIFLGTIILLPCLLIFNESEYILVNMLGLAYIFFIFYAVRKFKRFRQILVDFEVVLDYYYNKIFKL